MKIAIISGASSGIGMELAMLLDSYMLDELWLISRNYDKLLELSNKLKTKSRLISEDLSTEDAYYTIKKLLNEFNPEIKYLVCSAGVGYNGGIETLTENQITQIISTNCTALTRLNKISINYMKVGSRIINISSGSAFMPQPYFSVYAASKSYVNSFSRALGQELKSKSIYVTAVCPGPVDTPFFSSLENISNYKKRFLVSPKSVAIGALTASKKRKKLYTPSFSMKIVHLASKILPTNLILKFYKK